MANNTGQVRGDVVIVTVHGVEVCTVWVPSCVDVRPQIVRTAISDATVENALMRRHVVMEYATARTALTRKNAPLHQRLLLKVTPVLQMFSLEGVQVS